MDKKTKILATLGPSSNSLEMIEKLIDAGANMFRLNFSHGSHEYHQETLDNIRQAMQNKKKIVGILQDISGPKIRVAELKEHFLYQTISSFSKVTVSPASNKQCSFNSPTLIFGPEMSCKIPTIFFLFCIACLILSRVS